MVKIKYDNRSFLGKFILAPFLFVVLVFKFLYNLSKYWLIKRDVYGDRADYYLEELNNASPLFTIWLLAEVLIFKFSHIVCCPTWVVKLLEHF